MSGERLRPLLKSGGDIRMHVNNGAVASFMDTVPLLHRYGRLICHGLFVRSFSADPVRALARLLQIDEPLLAGYPEEVGVAVEAINVEATVTVRRTLDTQAGSRTATDRRARSMIR